ncbi:hypothetical protein BDP27DRAFT_1309871 [Rhodocollybia butyracea]|uniref:Secreted protein n=1 Tax=Rhodocollybia butyracea TaxID=206335 RepID=A0A9P5QAS1_9AGAR|nr:hypothetical protein BDP27DRAFT_1309871 [Rhodocollybia butyracea]
MVTPMSGVPAAFTFCFTAFGARLTLCGVSKCWARTGRREKSDRIKCHVDILQRCTLRLTVSGPEGYSLIQ